MFLTAIDLGTSKIKGVVTELRKDGSLFVVKTIKRKNLGMKRGEIINPEETVTPLFSVLKELRHFDKQCVKHLMFSIASTKSKFHQSHAVISIAHPDQEILPEDVERVMKESMAINIPPGWNILHSFPREFVVDDIEVDERGVVGLSGRRLEVHATLVLIFSAAFNNFLKVARLVLGKKQEVSGNLVFTPLASEHAVLSSKQRELGVVCIDIGAQTTNIAVFQDGKMILAKVLPVGSANITNDLAIGLKCSPEAAEKIKIEFGAASPKEVSAKEKIALSQFDEQQESVVSRKYIAEIIEVRVREVLSLVRKELEALKVEGELPAGAVITGGGSKMIGVLEVARQELKLPVQMGMPLRGRFEATNAHLTEQLDDPEMSVAVGMILHRLDLVKKKQPLGESGSGAYNINQSWFKKVLRTLMALD